MWRCTCSRGNHPLRFAFSGIHTLCVQAPKRHQPTKPLSGCRAHGCWERVHWTIKFCQEQTTTGDARTLQLPAVPRRGTQKCPKPCQKKNVKVIFFSPLLRRLRRHKPHKGFSVGKRKKGGRNKGESRIRAEANLCACSNSDRRVPFPGASYQSLSSLKVTDHSG